VRTFTHIAALALLLAHQSACATVSSWVHPQRQVVAASPALPADEAVTGASTLVQLAAASAYLRLLELDPEVARVLARDTSTGLLVDPASLPQRTVVMASSLSREPIREPAAREDAAPSDAVAAATPAAPAAHAASGRPTADGPRTDERWLVPVRAPRVTSRFGPRVDPITGQPGRMHRGIDFGGPVGTDVLAAASGVVVMGGYCDRGTGNCVVIDHPGGWRSQYFHLSTVRVRPGQRVRQGDVIGGLGSTGRSTGPHLHFQVGPIGGAAVDPETLFGRRLEPE